MKQEEIQKYANELGQKYFPNHLNIWARPNVEAHHVECACIEMYEYVKNKMAEKACEWLRDWDQKTMYELSMIMGSKFIEDFRKAMEE